MSTDGDKPRSTVLMGALALGAAAVAAVAAVALYRSSSSSSSSKSKPSRRRAPAAASSSSASNRKPSRNARKGKQQKQQRRRVEEEEEDEEDSEDDQLQRRMPMSQFDGDDDEEENEDGMMTDPADMELDDMTFQSRLITKVLQLFELEVEQLWPLRAAIEQFIQAEPQAAAQMRGSMPPEVIELAVEISDSEEAEGKITPEQKLALYCLLADAKTDDRDAATAAMKEAYRLWRLHPLRQQTPIMEVWMLLSLARSMRFQPEEEANKYLEQAKKLALKLFSETSIEVSSIDMDKAALLIAAKKPVEAKDIMLSVVRLREELLLPSDKQKYPIVFYTFISAIRFMCLEKDDATATDLLSRFIKRTFQTYNDEPVKAATQLALLVDVLGQHAAMLGAQKYLLGELKRQMQERNIEEVSLSFKLSLAEATAQIVSGDLLDALENLNRAMEQVKEMTGNERLQSMVTGMAYKAMVCVQLGGDINLQEADRCFKQVTPYLQHFDPNIMLAVITHLYAMKKEMNPEETEQLDTLIPQSIKEHMESEGVRAVYLKLMS